MKKKLIITLFAFAAGLTLKAQHLPNEVLQSFKTNFPGVESPQWEKNEVWFEAEYMENGVARSAFFDDNGQLMATAVAMNTAEVPEGIRRSVRIQFPQHRVKNVLEMSLQDGLKQYEVELQGPASLFEIMMDGEGRILSTQAWEDDSSPDADGNYRP